MTMAVAGFGYAFILGWEFALYCLGMFPLTIGTVAFLVIIIQTGYKRSFKAFRDSSSAAE